MGSLIDIENSKRRIMLNEPNIETVIGGNTYSSSFLAHFKTDMVAPIKSLKINFEPIISGSGTASPTNLRNISGYDTINITTCGVNLLNSYRINGDETHPTSVTRQGIIYTFSYNSDFAVTKIHLQGVNDNANAWVNLNYKSNTHVVPEGRYATSGYTTGANILLISESTLYVPEGSAQWIPDWIGWQVYDTRNKAKGTYTLNRIQLAPYKVSVSHDEDLYPMMCLADDIGCDFEPYRGTTYNINLGSTRYKGYYDLISGNLVLTHELLTLNTANMGSDENYPGWENTGVSNIVGEQATRTWTNQLLNIGTEFSTNYDTLFLSKSTYNYTLTEWKAMAINVQILVPYAEPQVINLTSPHPITTLRGINNIWSDIGIPEIKYWSHRVLNKPYNKIGGLPVFYNDSFYIATNTKICNKVKYDSDFFITGIFDTGSEGSKNYTARLIPYSGANGGFIRFYNDLDDTSVSYQNISVGYGTNSTVTFDAAGRYMVATVYKSEAANFYIYDNTNSYYICKGNSIV